MTYRRACLLIHRYNGLLLAGFLTVSGTTGAALAWKVPLERVFAPHLFVLEHHDAGTPRVDPLVVRRRVEEAYPSARADTADLSSNADAPWEFTLTPRAGGGRLESDDDVFADPFTGRILGSRRYGDIRQGVVNLIPFLYQLHEELAVGAFGVTCLGIVALLWTVDCFIGMYLSFPASQRKAGVSLTQRFTSWPRRFRPSLQIRWGDGGFRRLYDLHRASGVWLWLLLLIFAWTGVAFNLPGVYQTAMGAFGGTVHRSAPPAGCPAVSAQVLADAWPSNLEAGRKLMHARSEQLHFRIRAERFLSYEPENCQWTYRARSTLDVDPIGNTQLVWKQGSAGQAVFSAPTGETRAGTFTTWIEAIHEAQIGGPVVRWLVCLGGLVTAFLSVTGVLLYLRKVRS